MVRLRRRSRCRYCAKFYRRCSRTVWSAGLTPRLAYRATRGRRFARGGGPAHVQGDETGRLIANALEVGIIEWRPWYEPAAKLPDQPTISARLQHEFDTLVVDLPSARNLAVKGSLPTIAKSSCSISARVQASASRNNAANGTFSDMASVVRDVLCGWLPRCKGKLTQWRWSGAVCPRG